MDECRPLRSLRVCPLTSVTSNAGSGNMLSTPTICLVFDSWRFYDELRVRGSQNLRWWQVLAMFLTTCRTTSSCLASIRPLRTTDFSFGGRIGHMESFMRSHTSVVRTSKEAESPIEEMFTRCKIPIEPSSGRPGAIPTTRFHVPASIMASSFFLRIPSSLPHDGLQSPRQVYIRSNIHPATIHLAVGFARPSRDLATYAHTRRGPILPLFAVTLVA
jgi:hypothetical protein